MISSVPGKDIVLPDNLSDISKLRKDTIWVADEVVKLVQNFQLTYNFSNNETALTLYDGVRLLFKAPSNSTIDSSLDIYTVVDGNSTQIANGISLYWNDGRTLYGGEILTNEWVEVIYNQSNNRFIISKNPPPIQPEYNGNVNGTYTISATRPSGSMVYFIGTGRATVTFSAPTSVHDGSEYFVLADEAIRTLTINLAGTKYMGDGVKITNTSFTIETRNKVIGFKSITGGAWAVTASEYTV